MVKSAGHYQIPPKTKYRLPTISDGEIAHQMFKKRRVQYPDPINVDIWTKRAEAMNKDGLI